MIRRTARPALFALAACVGVLAAHRPASADLVLGHTYEKPHLQATPLPFTDQDFLRVRRGPVRAEIPLGRPLAVPIAIVNHTRFKVSALTNTNPRAGLTVEVQQIRPQATGVRRSYGPYEPGGYSPSPIVLYPFEEFPAEIVLWGDRETPNGLIFPTQGQYAVRLTLQIGAELSHASGSIPLDPFVVKVVEAPPEDAEIVRGLAESKAFPLLHLRRVPDGGDAQWREWADKHPDSSFAPYLNYALGLKHYREMVARNNDLKEFEIANRHLQLAVSKPNVHRDDALLDLLHMFDRIGAADFAKDTAIKLMKASAPALAARRGSQDIVRKYLIDSAEPDPELYWDLIE